LGLQSREKWADSPLFYKNGEERLGLGRSSVFIACSRFVVANAMTDTVRDAFRNRPHAVDAAPGFLRMEVTSPQDDPNEFCLNTYWSDEASFRSWYKSHAYRDSHRFIPRGLKVVRGSSRLRFFDLVSD
jgi:heme-degrading monooxygenase HmoA